MAQHKISWTEQTWNPLLGCTKVSAGCGMPRFEGDDTGGCYAIRQARMRASNPNPKIAAAFAGLVERNAAGELDWTGRVNLLPDRLELPLRWRNPKRIFVPSESDLFHDQVPDEYIARVFAVMAATPHHTYQIPTKRHGRMRSLLKSDPQNLLEHLHDGREAQALYDAPWPLPNLWLGVSVEDQATAALRILALLETPAAVRWVSAEPLLGPVDLGALATRAGTVDALVGNWDHVRGLDGTLTAMNNPRPLPAIDWVVVGGESGPGARPMHPTWARSLRDQVTRAGRAFHFKQWGEWSPVNEPWRSGTYDSRPALWLDHDGKSKPWGEFTGNEPDTTVAMYRVGKKAAGRELDGRVWDEYPAVTS